MTAVNSGGQTNQIYSVTFSPPGGSTNVLNTDETSFFSLQSLVFIPHIDTRTTPATYSFDLLAADNQKGAIYLYPGDFAGVNGGTAQTTGVLVPQGASIRYPNGLSADAAGNVFLVDEAPGSSPLPQVWVLPAANTAGVFKTAVLIDGTSFAKLQATVETTIVGPAFGVSPPAVCPGTASTCANTGDLLVLTANPGSVLKYPGSNGNGPLSANPTPTVLIPACPATPVCIPAGTVPAGIAIWPEDNSLLISLQGGSILRYSFSSGTPTQLADFFDGLPVGLFKIKTGYQGGVARAFVVQSGPGNHGSVIELGPDAPYGTIVQRAAVTTGVQDPEGIAVTNAVQALANTCQQGTGCDLLGGTSGTVLSHIVKGGGTLQGQLVENICVVPSDPRSSGPKGLCGDATLNVNQICPGFDNTGGKLVIPGYLCGQSGTTPGGSSGTGFALVQTLTNATQYNGTYVESAADSTSLLPPPSPPVTDNNPVCGAPGTAPIATLVWAPLQGEGTIIEGSNMVDLTSGCGTVHSGTTHTSLWALGLALDTTASELQTSLFQGKVVALQPLPNYAQDKYNNLTGTITQMTPTNIAKGVSVQLWNNFKKPLGCIDQSWTLFEGAANGQSSQPNDDFENAANLLTNASAATCESIVENNPGSFTQTPTHLNPSGEMRSRLANLYYTIETLILGHAASNTWPPPVSISVSPQSTTPGGSATLSWSVSAIASSCSWSSSDPNFLPGPPVGSGGTATVPASPRTKLTGAVTYSYKLTCAVPAGTMTPPTPSQMAVTAWLTAR